MSLPTQSNPFKPIFKPKRPTVRPFLKADWCHHLQRIEGQPFCAKFREWLPNCTVVCPCLKEKRS